MQCNAIQQTNAVPSVGGSIVNIPLAAFNRPPAVEDACLVISSNGGNTYACTGIITGVTENVANFEIPSGDVLPTKLYDGTPVHIGTNDTRFLTNSVDLGVNIIGKKLLVEIGTSNSSSADNIYAYQHFTVKFEPENSAGSKNIQIGVFSLNDWSNYVCINLGMSMEDDPQEPTKLYGGAFRQTQAQAEAGTTATPLNKFITAVWDITEIFN